MLSKKDVQWHCGPIQGKAFEDLRTALRAPPFLLYPDSKLPYTVVLDASGDVAGGVLMQDQGDGLRPIAFMSQDFKPAERRYSVYEKESAVAAWWLHPVFHIDKLKRYICLEEFLREVAPPPPVVVEDHWEYEVEDLIRHRGKGARR